MSSCLAGGSRPYGLDLEMLKSPSTSTITSHSSSSPSSTLSESSNSPHAISTRKPRTPRKRPNQNYNEAAALLSTAYPNIFSTKHLTRPCKFTKPQDSFWDESSDLLLPFRVFDNNSCFLLHQPIPENNPNSQTKPRVVNSREKLPFQGHRQVNDFREENDFHLCGGYQEDFDAESILDEEIGEGIDSIMGNLSVSNDSVNESNVSNFSGSRANASCYGYPIGLGFGGKFNFGFGFGLGMRRALRHVDDEGEWWRFPTVDVLDISPKLNKSPTEKKKKKVAKAVESKALESPPIENPTPKQQNENSIPKPSAELLLKLNYDEVTDAWSDRGSPFDEILRHEMAGNDFHVCLSSPAGNSNS